jgi:chorismate mutase
MSEMEDIEKLRRRIDETDEQILRFLGERVEICRSIGLLKNSQGMPIADPSREYEVYTKIRGKAGDFGLDADQVEEVYHQIVKMCSLVQEAKEKAE